MKKYLPLAVLLLLAFASATFAQEATASPSPTPKPKPKVSKAALLKQLSANETKLWEAWKNKDVKPFKAYIAADGIMIGGSGTAGKADAIKEMTTAPCDVKSFTLTDWKITLVNQDTAVLTYKGAAEGTCGGTAVPNTWSSSLWVRRGTRWQVFSHQETPVMP